MERSVNILVAEDDSEDYEFFEDAINGIDLVGCKVTQLYNGVETINFLLKKGKYKNDTQPMPDIIILDLNMHVLNGLAVLAEIKSKSDLQNIPTYVLTTSRSDVHKKKCEELGCAGFFIKPAKVSEMRRVISQMVSEISREKTSG
jgi:two-component system response regulator